MQIFGFLSNILGYALWAAFYVFQNFGLAIIVFTVIVKLLILPFSVKQQKSMLGEQQGFPRNKRNWKRNTATTASFSRRK